MDPRRSAVAVLLCCAACHHEVRPRGAATDGRGAPTDGRGGAPTDGRGAPDDRGRTAEGTSEGMASFYGPGFEGHLTASGERFDPHALTAAHRTLPFGTRVRVTNLENGRSVVVRINDRGPYAHARIIDVSLEAARRLDLLRRGVGRVRLEPP